MREARKSPPPSCPSASVAVTWGGEDVESCESAGKLDTNRNQRKTGPRCKIRIRTFGSKLTPTEKQCVRRRWNSVCLAVPHRRFEMNLLGCPDRVVVEAVTQSMDDAHHMQAARGRQNDFEKNFAFNLETASLLGIDRGGLENDFRRCAGGGRSFSRVRPYGRRSGNVGITKRPFAEPRSAKREDGYRQWQCHCQNRCLQPRHARLWRLRSHCHSLRRTADRRSQELRRSRLYLG